MSINTKKKKWNSNNSRELVGHGEKWATRLLIVAAREGLKTRVKTSTLLKGNATVATKWVAWHINTKKGTRQLVW
jgi:hypothetical protein